VKKLGLGTPFFGLHHKDMLDAAFLEAPKGLLIIYLCRRVRNRIIVEYKAVLSPYCGDEYISTIPMTGNLGFIWYFINIKACVIKIRLMLSFLIFLRYYLLVCFIYGVRLRFLLVI